MAITKIQSNAFPASIDLSNIDLTLGANEVLTANIADSNITTAKIADGAVHTGKVADLAITHAKLHTDMDLTSKTVTLPALTQNFVVNGNVGIGESSPDSKLHIRGDASGGGAVWIQTDGAFAGTDNASLNFRHYDDTGNPTAQIKAVGVSNYTGDMVFSIRQGGTSGAGGAGMIEALRLNASGGITFNNDQNANLNFFVKSGSVANAFMVDGSSGNVGIGTTSPSANLEIKPAGADGSLKITSDANSGHNVVITQGYNTYITASDNLYMGVGGTADDLSIVGGNVGIGTTSPEALLHVQNSNGGGSIQIGRDTGPNEYQYLNFGGNAAGDDAWQIGKKNNSSDVVGPTKGFYVYDLAASTARLVISTGGNVGIGTTDPSVALQVGDEWHGTPYIDIMKMWRTAELQGYYTAASDGGGVSYSWHTGGVVRIDTSVGSHNWDLGKVYLEEGTYYILIQYRPSPDQHGWSVYGSNSNAHRIRLQSDAGWGAFNTYLNVNAQANKDVGYSMRFRSGASTRSAGTYRIGMQTDPYSSGGYKCWVEAAYLMKIE